jgi:hypothetical protein
MVQKTDYPLSGKVTLIVNPEEEKTFSLFLRVPDRSTSTLYKPSPLVQGLKSVLVNGKTVPQKIVNGYAEINRKWKSGDIVEIEMPLSVQTITPDERIEANRGRIALRYGPMIFNVEKADQPDIEKYIGMGPLTAKWRGDILDGVLTIEGTWNDGTPLIAIPNYARNNRNIIKSTYSPSSENNGGGSIVSIKSNH